MTSFFPNKNKSIESLEYFFFLQDSQSLILNKLYKENQDPGKNSLIKEFLDSLEQKMFRFCIMGFALTEAMALFVLMMAFLILFTFL